jgi:type II secretory pathway component PulF
MALDVAALERRLERERLWLIDARAQKIRRRKGAKSRDLIDLFYHLAVTLEAGIPMLQALEDLRDNGAHPFADVLEDLERKIQAGATLSSGLADYREIFPKLAVALVQAGEQAGTLDRVLRDLVAYLEWREQLRSQIKSAITYPIVLLVAVIAFFALVSGYILPSFLAIFAELHVVLPLPTRILMAAPEGVQRDGVAVAGVVVVTVVSLVAWRRTPDGRLRFDRALMRVPVLGLLLKMTEMSRFTHNFGVLYGVGVPAIRCLEYVQDIAQNAAIAAMIADVRGRIAGGNSLTDALGLYSLMPSMTLRMIATGERSGRLEEALERVSKFYDREVPAIIGRAIAIFTNGVMVLMGVAVITLALALFLPLYSMMGNVGD